MTDLSIHPLASLKAAKRIMGLRMTAGEIILLLSSSLAATVPIVNGGRSPDAVMTVPVALAHAAQASSGQACGVKDAVRIVVMLAENVVSASAGIAQWRDESFHAHGADGVEKVVEHGARSRTGVRGANGRATREGHGVEGGGSGGSRLRMVDVRGSIGANRMSCGARAVSVTARSRESTEAQRWSLAGSRIAAFATVDLTGSGVIGAVGAISWHVGR